MINIAFYFKKWRDIVSFRKYDEWCELNNERLAEEEFASQSGMDSEHWCWNCKYSDCDRHGDPLF